MNLQYRLALFLTLFVFSFSGLSLVQAQETPSENVPFDEIFTHHTEFVADGIRLHYVIGGQGDPIVLVHGWPHTWIFWRDIMPQLAENHTVIAVDLRGAGDSDIPATGYDKRTMAADVHTLVETLGLGPIHLVTHDIGGMVGFAYAHEYPDDVRSFTILDIVPPGVEPYWSERSLWHFAFHNVPSLPEALIEGQEALYLSWFYNNFSYDPSAISDAEVSEYAASYARPGSLSATLEWYRAFPQDIEQNQIYIQSQLNMPVLALGAERGYGPAVLEMMQGLATNVQGGIIEDSGHFIAEEQPEVLLEELQTFLDSVPEETS